MSGSIVRVLQEQKLSEQHIQNFSFDHDFGLLIVELAGYDSTTDSIKRVAVNNLGHLLISNAPIESIWEYNEVGPIADSALTTLLTHTVTSFNLYIDSILSSGELDAEYIVVIDGSTKARYKTSEQDRTAKFTFPSPQIVEVGSILDIKVIHFQTGSSGNFNASLMGHK